MTPRTVSGMNNTTILSFMRNKKKKLWKKLRRLDVMDKESQSRALSSFGVKLVEVRKESLLFGDVKSYQTTVLSDKNNCLAPVTGRRFSRFSNVRRAKVKRTDTNYENVFPEEKEKKPLVIRIKKPAE
jgi:hypothetical protein